MLRKSKFKRKIALILVVTVIFYSLVPSFSQAQAILPAPGPGLVLSSETGSNDALMIKGMKVDPKSPLKLDFIVPSNDPVFRQGGVKAKAEVFIKSFLTALAVPEDRLWVNLSPYEKDRVISDDLGQTRMGQDLLETDYVLKQLASSFSDPRTEPGKLFWDKVYKTAREKFGTTDIPVSLINRVWIVPEQAEVYEHGTSVYVTKARLKVLTEKDYLAFRKEAAVSGRASEGSRGTSDDAWITDVLQKVIVPVLTEEVNTASGFARLRQIFHAVILAKWFKETLRDSFLKRNYADRSITGGLAGDDVHAKEKIYEQYLEAYRKGAYDIIHEESGDSSGSVARRYFSGGLRLNGFAIGRSQSVSLDKSMAVISSSLQMGFDQSQRQPDVKRLSSFPLPYDGASEVFLAVYPPAGHESTPSHAPEVHQLILRDAIRSEAKAVIAELHRMGIKVTILTGDNEEAANRVAKELGIDDVKAGQNDAQKTKFVEELIASGQTHVLLIGDGVNDAKALAIVNANGGLGVTFASASFEAKKGAGTFFLENTNDGVLLKIPTLLKLSQKTRKIEKWNFVIAGFALALTTMWTVLSILTLANVITVVSAIALPSFILAVVIHEGPTIYNILRSIGHLVYNQNPVVMLWGAVKTAIGVGKADAVSDQVSLNDILMAGFSPVEKSGMAAMNPVGRFFKKTGFEMNLAIGSLSWTLLGAGISTLLGLESALMLGLLFFPAYLLAGVMPLKEGWEAFVKGIKRGRLVIDKHWIMLLAAGLMVVMGHAIEAAALLVIFSASGAIEERLETGIQAMMDNLVTGSDPQKAVRIQGDKEKEVDVKELQPGDQIVLYSGDQVPVDGRIDEVDTGLPVAPGETVQAEMGVTSLTGEDVPVHLDIGSEVRSGSIVHSRRIVMTVMRDVTTSSKAVLQESIEDIKKTDTRAQQLIDHLAAPYSILLLALSGGIFGLSLWLGLPQAVALSAAILFLIGGSPCAVFISSSAAYSSGIFSAARSGILPRSSSALVSGATIKHVVFDKTGTLTEGNFSELLSVRNKEGNLSDRQVMDVLQLASSVAQYSSHPVSNGIVKILGSRGGYIPKLRIQPQLVSGGMIGVLEDGRRIVLGSRALVESYQIDAAQKQTDYGGIDLDFKLRHFGNLDPILSFPPLPAIPQIKSILPGDIQIAIVPDFVFS